MNNEYSTPEVIEVGRAEDLILGSKNTSGLDEGQNVIPPDNDLDD